MPPKKKPPRSKTGNKLTTEFEGVRSKPRSGSPGTRARRDDEQSWRRGEGGPRTSEPRGERARSDTRQEKPGNRSPAGEVAEQFPDPRFDPEVMFRILSDKIAAKVDKAAMKAGASAAQEVSRQLTAELDAAIAGAQSTAGKMGVLVQRAVQAAVDEALRTAVLNATRVHEEHLAQLALIDRTAQTARDLSSVQMRIDAEMRRSGLIRVITPDPDAFNLTNAIEHVDGDSYEVLAPAYVDTRSGRIVQRGEMQRMPAAHTGPEREDR